MFLTQPPSMDIFYISPCLCLQGQSVNLPSESFDFWPSPQVTSQFRGVYLCPPEPCSPHRVMTKENISFKSSKETYHHHHCVSVKLLVPAGFLFSSLVRIPPTCFPCSPPLPTCIIMMLQLLSRPLDLESSNPSDEPVVQKWENNKDRISHFNSAPSLEISWHPQFYFQPVFIPALLSSWFLTLPSLFLPFVSTEWIWFSGFIHRFYGNSTLYSLLWYISHDWSGQTVVRNNPNVSEP